MPEHSSSVRNRLFGRHWSASRSRSDTFDAPHNRRRIGRVLIGLGRDAADVPITMSFGKQSLEVFRIYTEEIDLAAVSDGLIVKGAKKAKVKEFVAV
jgi:hypothetical protein